MQLTQELLQDTKVLPARTEGNDLLRIWEWLVHCFEQEYLKDTGPGKDTGDHQLLIRLRATNMTVPVLLR